MVIQVTALKSMIFLMQKTDLSIYLCTLSGQIVHITPKDTAKDDMTNLEI